MSPTRQSAYLALAVTVAVAACTDIPLDPAGPEVAPSFSEGVADASAPSAAINFFVAASGPTLPERFTETVTGLGATVQATYPELGVAVISAPNERFATGLRRVPGIAFVEPEPMFYIDEPVAMSEPAAAGVDGSIESSTDPTLAYFYPVQWNMWAIDAPGAWAAGRLGSSDVTVAILDSGIDYLHQDLYGRVDLSRSISFLPQDDALAAVYFPSRHPITDLHYHGTHVASTVAANGLGMAGVTSQVTLIGVKVCSVYGGCPGSAIFAGIAHAVANGADVVNMSLDGSFSKRDFPGAVSVFQGLFTWAGRHGVTIVVAAGNDALDLDHDADGFKTYCSVTNVVCVSATGPTSGGTFGPGPYDNPDTPADYTNYGRSAISVAGPGGNVTGVLAACSTSTLISGLGACRTSPDFYLALGGTSMAAPHVSGVAALLVEDVGRSPAQIRARLQQSADDLGQPGTDPFYGKGRVNAAAAVGVN